MHKLINDLGFARIMLQNARNLVQYYSGTKKEVRWSYWMRRCKARKAELRRAALSCHWRLYLSGKTNVRPTVDMRLDEMLETDRLALMAHYRTMYRTHRKTRGVAND